MTGIAFMTRLSAVSATAILAAVLLLPSEEEEEEEEEEEVEFDSAVDPGLTF